MAAPLSTRRGCLLRRTSRRHDCGGSAALRYGRALLQASGTRRARERGEQFGPRSQNRGRRTKSVCQKNKTSPLGISKERGNCRRKGAGTTFSTVSWCLLGSETASSGSHILTSSHATWAHSRFTQSWARMGQPLKDLAIQNRHTAVSHRRGPSAKSSSAQMTSVHQLNENVLYPTALSNDQSRALCT